MSNTTKTASAKKTTSAKATKPVTAEKTPREPKLLRVPQVRILAALVKAKNGYTRKELSEKAPFDFTSSATLIGVESQERRDANEAKWGIRSLLSQKAIKFTQIGGPGEEVNEERIEITATGKQLLARAEKE